MKGDTARVVNRPRAFLLVGVKNATATRLTTKIFEDQKSVLKLIMEEGSTNPLNAGVHVGRSYCHAASYGHRVLMPMVYMGILRKEGANRGVRYVLA